MFEQSELIEVGDTVDYVAIGGEMRTVLVHEVSNDIKHNRAGFAGRTENGETYWGYNSQIFNVTKKGYR